MQNLLALGSAIFLQELCLYSKLVILIFINCKPMNLFVESIKLF